MTLILLTKHIESVEDEDEVLTALSEELGNFVEYVGGPEWGHVLLSPLENLAAIEEPLVREKVERVLMSAPNLADYYSGGGVSEQDMRTAFLSTSRKILHSTHN